MLYFEAHSPIPFPPAPSGGGGASGGAGDLALQPTITGCHTKIKFRVAVNFSLDGSYRSADRYSSLYSGLNILFQRRVSVFLLRCSAKPKHFPYRPFSRSGNLPKRSLRSQWRSLRFGRFPEWENILMNFPSGETEDPPTPPPYWDPPHVTQSNSQSSYIPYVFSTI